VFGALQMTS